MYRFSGGRRLASVLTALVVLTATAAAAEKLAVVPLHATGDIPPAIAEGFRTHLRGLAAGSADVLDNGAVTAAMGRTGTAATCADAACATTLATELGARFVLTGAVDNTDEIYKVRLWLFDRSSVKQTAADGVCELCAAEEVDRTIGAAFAGLRPALVVAAPPPAPAQPKTIAVEVTTVPDGADVFVDGTPAGKSPIVLRVKPGKHVIGVRKAETEPVERTISAVDRTIKLAFKLKAAAPTPAVVAATPTPAPTPTPTPVTPPPTVVPPPPPPTGGGAGGSDHTLTGAGMLIGGSLLAAGGAYVTWLDGQITCTDGLGERECPTVYNTKGVGMTALGLGAALIGSGLTLIIVEALDDDGASAFVTPTDGGAAVTLGGRF